jgi:pyruvate dehydrogenase E1 component alpha subunit
MPEQILSTFSVRRLEILNQDGVVDDALMPPLAEAEIRRMYELMVLSRFFDKRAVDLQREGRIGTYPPLTGQEASQVGSALALSPRDWVVPSFREMGVHLTLGFPIHQLFQYWSGDERGLITPDHLNIFPFCVAVGTQILHAVGAAMAARYRKAPVVATAYFGDGATSKGDFHEGFNMAGLFKLPVVFICQNNQWAISIPVTGQTGAASLAQKAIGYGFEGIQVDGNDVFAVYAATRQALDKARNGDGPTFIECLTYRMSNHTTADDAARYRPTEEVAAWQARDPILRLKRYMTAAGLFCDEYEQRVMAESTMLIDNAVETMEAIAPPNPLDMFDYTLQTLSPRQAGQREEC